MPEGMPKPQPLEMSEEQLRATLGVPDQPPEVSKETEMSEADMNVAKTLGIETAAKPMEGRVTSEAIASEEARLGASVSQLRENINKPPKVPEEDSYEKIKASWDSAKSKATTAFLGLFGAAALGAFGMEHYSSVVEQGTGSSIGSMDPHILQNAMDMMQTIMPLTEGAVGSAVAVPLIILAYSKISGMMRERNLYKAA